MMLVELSQAALLGTLKPVAMAFVEESGKLGLRISGMSTLCPTTSTTVRALQVALQHRGVTAVLADGGRDLGGEVRAGGGVAPIESGRLPPFGGRQAARLAGPRLFGRGGKAAMLTRTGALPLASLSQHCGGASPVEIERFPTRRRSL